MRRPESNYDLLRRLVTTATGDDCVLWPGYCNPKGGHATVWVKGKVLSVSRLSWSIANGEEIPAGLSVLHRCDVGSCINPAHLFLGTQADNIADMIKKGRYKNVGQVPVPLRGQPRGERNGKSVLTVAIVREWRRLFAAGVKPGQVARDFAVSRSAVENVHKRRTWGHVQ